MPRKLLQVEFDSRRPTQLALKPGQAKRQMRQQDAIRSLLPVDAYVGLLHEAALTGRMPRLDPQTLKPLEGKYRNSEGTLVIGPIYDEIDPDERRSLLETLLRKALPDMRAKPHPDEGKVVEEEDVEKAGGVQRASADQLRNIIDADFSPASD